MAKLIITRSSEWMNRARAIKITINDKAIGEIANGQVRDVELPAGDYVIKAALSATVFVLLFLLKMDFAGFLVLPVLFIMIYYITIGRNNYLVIK